MSFETLIWLGLTLLFVIAPLFGNKGKKGDSTQQPRQPGQRPGAPPASGQPRTRSAAPTRPAESRGGPEEQGGWAARLEEAQRRIESALSEESAQVPRQQQRPPAPKLAPRATAASAARSQRAGGTLTPRTISGRPVNQPRGTTPARTIRQPRTPAAASRPDRPRTPPPSRSASAASKQASVDRARRLRASESASEPQVTRKGDRSTYTVRRRRRADGGLFDAGSVVNGFIWHQILSEPRHKRGNRRRT